MKNLRIVLIVILAVAAAGLWGSVLAAGAGEEETAQKGNVTVVENIEQTESLPHPAFIKEPFVPVVPDGTNIASEAKFEDNGHTDVYLVGKAQDGETAGPSYWEGKADDYPNILTATFSETRTIHALKLMLCPQPIWGARVQTFSVEISDDGEEFTEFLPEKTYDFDPDTGNELVLEFEQTQVKAIRLIFTGNTGATGAQIAELEIYSD